MKVLRSRVITPPQPQPNYNNNNNSPTTNINKNKNKKNKTLMNNVEEEEEEVGPTSTMTPTTPAKLTEPLSPSPPLRRSLRLSSSSSNYRTTPPSPNKRPRYATLSPGNPLNNIMNNNVDIINNVNVNSVNDVDNNVSDGKVENTSDDDDRNDGTSSGLGLDLDALVNSFTSVINDQFKTVDRCLSLQSGGRIARNGELSPSLSLPPCGDDGHEGVERSEVELEEEEDEGFSGFSRGINKSKSPRNGEILLIEGGDEVKMEEDFAGFTRGSKKSKSPRNGEYVLIEGGSEEIMEEGFSRGRKKSRSLRNGEYVMIEGESEEVMEEGFSGFNRGGKKSKSPGSDRELSGLRRLFSENKSREDDDVVLVEEGETVKKEWSGKKSRSASRLSREEKGKSSVGRGFVYVLPDEGEVKEEEEEGGSERNWRSPRRFSREEKGKGVMRSDDVDVADDDGGFDDLNLELGLNMSNVDLNLGVGSDEEMEFGGFDEPEPDDVEIPENVGSQDRKRSSRRARSTYMMDRFKDIARRNASKYALFNAQQEENQEGLGAAAEVPVAEPQPVNAEDWPGPFSTAMKIIRDREKNLSKLAQKSGSAEGAFSLVSWTPKKNKGPEWSKRTPPSLQSLCLDILAQNVDAISSLDYVPDVLRHKLCQMLCDSRRMNPHFFSLLLEGTPSEVRVADCSWLEEEEFEKSMEACDTIKLTVLQLDLCGHCISDSSLLKALVPKRLPALTAISLKGACRISDVGLSALVSTAPALRSMNLSQCSLLTDVGIKSLADSLGSILKELYLDDCDTLDAMRILPVLKSLEGLEVLSLRGIGGVSDKFIKELLSSKGQNMKELILANCVNLTDLSLKAIAETCSQLCVLDLSHLRNLTDIGMAHLATGCRGLQDLRLCRNLFSDDAIAAFLENSGESLKELSLNNVGKVGQNTTLSLASRCKNLQSLDLSWCRSLTDEALGLIADSCLSLRLLKIFGCTQITKAFIDGHSNPHLQVIGMKLTAILEHIKRPDFQQGPLHYSAVPSF